MSGMSGTIIKRRVGGLLGLLGFWHMGIWDGGDWVIQLNGESKKDSDAVVRLTSLAEFADRKTVYVHATPKSRRHGEAVWAEALRFHELGDANGLNKQYDILRRNCETLCIHCYEVAYNPMQGGSFE